MSILVIGGAGFIGSVLIKEMLLNNADIVVIDKLSLGSTDYIDTNKVDFGILICGSANGVAMTANKYQNVRAGICWTKEIVSLIRQHNNANILCIPARYTAIPQALEMVEIYLNTEFEGGRHQNRVSKIACQ